MWQYCLIPVRKGHPPGNPKNVVCRLKGTAVRLKELITDRTDSRSLVPRREHESFLRLEPGPLLHARTHACTHARLCTENGDMDTWRQVTRNSYVFLYFSLLLCTRRRRVILRTKHTHPFQSEYVTIWFLRKHPHTMRGRRASRLALQCLSGSLIRRGAIRYRYFESYAYTLYTTIKKNTFAPCT